MSSFEETLARMKGLYTYGKELNEGNDFNSHTLEYHAIAADGKSYGIIRECNKYYIKSAPKDKEMMAESYEYLGGFCNKKNYEYSSYANALKNFELKMASINEACEGNVNISTLDPFKKEEFLVEGTDRMKNEIARQRQIMYNASMIMNEANEIGATEKNNVVKKQNPNEYEAPKKNGNSINDGTEAKVVDQDNVKKRSGHKPNIVGPFDQKVNEGTCPKCGKGKCECKNCNEEAGDISDEPLMPNTRNWAGPKMGASEPDQIGWDMEGQEKVNEETNEWDEGLPGSAGIGEADTDHNNDPFNKSINEGDEGFDDEEPTEDEFNDEEFDSNTDDFDSEEEFDDGLGSEEEFGDEETDDFGDEETEDFGEEDEFGPDYEFGGEDGEDFSTEDEDFGDEEPESEEGEEDEFGDETEYEIGNDFDSESEDFGEDDFESEDFGEEEPEDEIDECGDMNQMFESKQRKMNRIVESVVKDIIKEDELHVFGKHPGYRKKPMELPTTGEDQNQWGRDWNDDSVHNEEPFGKQIGNGDPFTQLVNSVTKDVMYQLKKGVPIEGMNKKKVD